MSYETEMLLAAERTLAWGFGCDHQAHHGARYVSPETCATVEECAQSVLGNPSPESIKAQCFAINALMIGPLEKALGVPITYTLGYVNLGRGPVFHTPEDQLKAMLDAGHPKPQALELHAWLTLPSNEIIDLTLATTLGLLWENEELVGRSSFIHPTNLKGGQSYHPQLLGYGYLRGIGLIVDVPTIII